MENFEKIEERKRYRKKLKPRKNQSKLSKPICIKVRLINYAFLKSKPNVSAYIDSLITTDKNKVIDKEIEVEQWRQVLYPNRR